MCTKICAPSKNFTQAKENLALFKKMLQEYYTEKITKYFLKFKKNWQM